MTACCTTGAGPVTVFDFSEFIALYPTFACLNGLAAQGYFDLAAVYHRNDGFGPVKLAAQQKTLMYLMTAHVATLMASGANGGAAPVGRLSSASEGSVSASFELAASMNMNQAWFAQSQYGLMYWQATAGYRQMRYVVPVPRNFTPWPSGGGGVIF